MNKPRHLRAYYPSGNKVEVYGRIAHDELPDGMIVLFVVLAEPAVVHGTRIPFDGALVLDPRAMIIDVDTRELISNPRHAPAEAFTPEMSEWMDQHPEWPTILELETA